MNERPHPDEPTLAEQLARFSAGLSYRNLSREVIHEAKRRVIDTLACALGGWTSAPAKIARTLAGSVRLPTGATLLGENRRTTPDLAAFANGTAVRYLDYNDTYLSKEPAHPSDNLPAALAVAETANRDGKALIEAIVLGYEIQCRLCDAAALRPKGWDHVTYGAFSTALVAAKLRRLSPAKTVHAVGLAGTPNQALRQTRVGEISMWKAAAFANAARNGLFAAELARLGMTGPAPIFEGEKGFMKVVSGRLDLPPLDPKGPFKIMSCYIKYYPVEYHAQSAVQAALKLRERIEGRWREIEAVTIRTSDVSYEIIGRDPEKWRPKTRETADHSIPYVVAVALVDGAVGLPQFSMKRINDPKLAALVQKVRVVPDPELSALYPDAIANVVEIKTPEKLYRERIDDPRGHPKNRMTDGEIEEKFRGLAAPLLKEVQTEKILDRLWDLERSRSIGEIMSLFHIKGKR